MLALPTCALPTFVTRNLPRPRRVRLHSSIHAFKMLPQWPMPGGQRCIVHRKCDGGFRLCVPDSKVKSDPLFSITACHSFRKQSSYFEHNDKAEGDSSSFLDDFAPLSMSMGQSPSLTVPSWLLIGPNFLEMAWHSSVCHYYSRF